MNLFQRVHVKLLGQSQLLQLGRNHLGAESLHLTRYHPVHIIAFAVGPLARELTTVALAPLGFKRSTVHTSASSVGLWGGVFIVWPPHA